MIEPSGSHGDDLTQGGQTKTKPKWISKRFLKWNKRIALISQSISRVTLVKQTSRMWMWNWSVIQRIQMKLSSWCESMIQFIIEWYKTDISLKLLLSAKWRSICCDVACQSLFFFLSVIRQFKILVILKNCDSNFKPQKWSIKVFKSIDSNTTSHPYI